MEEGAGPTAELDFGVEVLEAERWRGNRGEWKVGPEMK